MEAAREFGALAIEKWAKVPYPAKWVVLFPLLAAERTPDGMEIAVSYMRELLSPAQCRLAGNTSRCLERALSMWESGDASRFEAALDAALAAAIRDGYL